MSKPDLHQIASLVIDRPLLLTPGMARNVISVIGERIGLDVTDMPTPDASRFKGEYGDGGGYMYRAIDGVASIPVIGSLVNRGAWVGAYCGLVSYEGVKAQIDRALEDPDVHSGLLDFQSFGGEAVGCFELANYIAEASKIKPFHAVVNGAACSAAYAMAAGCQRITAIPTAIVGSIGVVLVHMDRSKQADMAGIKPTFIHAGAHKVDGNPFAPLPEEVRADLQAEVNMLYGAFVDHVAASRGLSAEEIRATEARTYSGNRALELGLVDAIGSFDDALKFLTETPAVSLTAQPRGLSMTTKNGQAAASGGEHQITQADMDAASAAANKEGHDAGVKAEQDRVNGILSLEDAKGREGLAMNAIKNGLTVEQAKGMLADAPKADAPNGGQLTNDGPGQYEQHRKKMEEQQPVLGAGGGQDKKPSAGERLLGLAAKTYGGNK